MNADNFAIDGANTPDLDAVDTYVNEFAIEIGATSDAIADEPVEWSLEPGEPIFAKDIVGGARPQSATPTPKTADEPGEIDPKINTKDMTTLIYSELSHKTVAGSHIGSIDAFYQYGIRQIVTKVFVVEGRLRNERDKTDEDRGIAEIQFRVNFTDIELTPPATPKYKSGTEQMLTPNMARVKNLTYSCNMKLDATITATAFFKDGTKKIRTAEIKRHRIGAIPCVVRSCMCNTANKSRAELIALEEDPDNPGGYYIINGIEYIVENLENTTNNELHVFNNSYQNERTRGTILSKPGDAYENSYQMILRYYDNGSITLELTTGKFEKFEVPFYVFFRALGITSDKEIVDHIVYGVDNNDDNTKKLKNILSAAFNADDEYFRLRDVTDPAEIISRVGSKILRDANTAAGKKDDNIAKYINSNFFTIVDRFFLPHIGSGIEHRVRKLRHLGYYINKLLLVNRGIVMPTDRDDLQEKSIHAAGVSNAKAFKTNFNFAVVQDVKKQFLKDFAAIPFSNVNLVDSFESAINADALRDLLEQSITAGNKTLTHKKTEIVNRISSQPVYHKNDMNVKSTLRSVSAANTSASKQNERADVQRRVQPSMLGFEDPCQSADTGEQVGMKRQLGCTASIAGASSSFALEKTVLADTTLIPLDDVSPSSITRDRLTKVFVNGKWIGCCRDSVEFYKKYRDMRRHDEIHYQTTIIKKLSVRELHFRTDVGRLIRPLVIVYNNIDEYDAAYRAGRRDVEFSQWIKLTKKHIHGLQSRRLTVDDLRRDGIIEYITAGEQQNLLLAMNIDTLRDNQHNITRQYTHCDIDQAMFGIVTLASPYTNHSNATRTTFYTNHRRQSAGWFALNYPYRIDKNTTLQWYCEKPLVSSFSDSLTYPNGHNCMVAVTIYGGYGQEDSLIVNKSSIDCGMFNASYYTYERAELDKGEQFGNLDFPRTMGIKKNANYEYIRDGLIEKGTRVKKGYVLVVKVFKLPKPERDFIYTDKSIVYKRDEEMIVENAVITRNDKSNPIAKVKLRAARPIEQGDKGSSRTGNKGIVGLVVSREDMFYDESGHIVDVVVNPHSFPTRMAVNQKIEIMFATIAALLGVHIDGTMFNKVDIETGIKLLQERGIDACHRRLYNGRTGMWLDTLVFMGMNVYQRLQKFVIDENYAVRGGPTSAANRQPLDGKAHDGGLRVGEMEKDVICAHGKMRALYEKFYTDSDGIYIQVCRDCGKRAVANEKVGIYKCKNCGDRADICNVPSSWVANTFIHEASGMNMDMEFTLTPHVFPVPEADVPKQ
jgi:DNA-directed RNA polymerase beta subunit